MEKSLVRVDDGLVWRRSSRCESGTCLEVARLQNEAGVAVRDSKDPGGGFLMFSVDAWVTFVQAVQRGEFDEVPTVG